MAEPITEAQLEPLIHLLLSSDIEVLKASSLAISNFALHGPRTLHSLLWANVNYRVYAVRTLGGCGRMLTTVCMRYVRYIACCGRMLTTVRGTPLGTVCGTLGGCFHGIQNLYTQLPRSLVQPRPHNVGAEYLHLLISVCVCFNGRGGTLGARS